MTMTSNMHGASLMIAAMAGYTINDAFMKAALATVPFFQAIFLRGILTCTLLVIVLFFMRAHIVPLVRKDKILVLIRTLAEVLGTLFFLQALANMEFANLTAILQALPLTVTMASAILFREAVGWRRWAAILIGLCGVLLIVKPGADGFTIYSVYALMTVAAVTVRDIVVRRLSASVPSATVALSAALGVTTLGAIGSVGTDWVSISLMQSAQLFSAAMFLVFGYLTSVMTMRVGDIGFIAPFRYTSLLFALMLGFLIFGEWPDYLTLIGSVIVVATGVFTLYRERGLASTKGPVPLRTR